MPHIKKSSLSENDAYLIDLHDYVLAAKETHPAAYEQIVAKRFPAGFDIERLCEGYYSSAFEDTALRKFYFKAFGLPEPVPVVRRDWIDIQFLSGRRMLAWPPQSKAARRAEQRLSAG